jgi:hypothetical protein
MIATSLTTETTPPSGTPSPGSTSPDRGRMWWLGIEAKVPPRSHAPGGGGNAGQATTAPEAGGEATGAAMVRWVWDYLRGPGMWCRASRRKWFPRTPKAIAAAAGA